jgi:Uma2 family endonuclease
MTTISPPSLRVEPASPAVSSTPRMTAEEFLRWEHPGIAEWTNGEVFIMTVKNEHQRIVDFLNRLLGIFTQVFGLGTVRSAPYAMRAEPGGNLREPDLMFVSSAHRARITSDVLDGPADLIVEVVSDESVARDYDEKFAEYQDAGVPEYWVIDPRPNRLRTSFFVLGADGRYRPAPADDANIFRSTILPGFWIKLDWFWTQDADPDPLAALAEIAGVEALIAALTPRT